MNNQPNSSGTTVLPDHIRESLSKHPKHQHGTCLECGYVGLMGISRTDAEWKGSSIIYVVYVIALIFSVTFIWASFWMVAILLAALVLVCGKIFTYFECPNCLVEIQK